MRFFKITFLGLIGLLSAVPAWGWHHETTHREINTAALKAFQAKYDGTEKYARSRLDPTITCTGPAVTNPGKELITETDVTSSLADWIRNGGYFADQPELWAALRHFYDPLKVSGVSYLTDTIPGDTVNPQVDAKALALTAEGNAWTDNGTPAQYNWNWALNYYGLAMTQDANRERNLARAFRAIGQVMHLLADMTQPAHVRNDSHPVAEPVEDTIRTQEVIDSAGGTVDSRVTLMDQSVEQLFENISRFTNKYFYSSDTVYDAASGVQPANGETPYPNPQFKDLTYDNATLTYSGTFNGTAVPMAQMTLTHYVSHSHGEQLESTTTSWHVPPGFALGQAKVLIPIAVTANAEVINRFLPTLNATLTVTPTGATKAKIDGALTHDLAKDPEWTGRDPILYNGPGALVRKGGAKIADLTLTSGTVNSTTVTLAQGDVVYLEIKAGGRTFTSEDKTFNGNTSPVYVPTIAWKLADLNGKECGTGTGAAFNKSVTSVFIYGEGAVSHNVTTTITASMTAPEVTKGSQFETTLTVTRNMQCVPAIDGLTATRGRINLTEPSVDSLFGGKGGPGDPNPNTISLKLTFRPITPGGDLYYIDQTATPGFMGYVSSGTTFIPQGATGGYAGNWNLTSFSGSTGVTLNGNISLDAAIEPWAPTLSIGNQYNTFAYRLHCSVSYQRK